MYNLSVSAIAHVHCRTGSLENKDPASLDSIEVHCRTGSLEILQPARRGGLPVHCRTGSLEIEPLALNV